jgi:acylphosphatase
MAKELILTGKVQNVFCRRYCTEIAKKIGLKGSASNLNNGNVRVIIDSNDNEKINSFIQALKQNPFGFTFYGSIDNVIVSEYTGSIKGDYVF